MAGAMTASRRLMAVSFGFRGIPPGAPSGGGRPTWGPTLALFGLVTKQHGPQPLEAELGFLQGKQQPKIPLEHVVQHAPIVGSQAIPGEPCTQCLAVFAAQL
jgi:hypothetical protein